MVSSGYCKQAARGLVFTSIIFNSKMHYMDTSYYRYDDQHVHPLEQQVLENCLEEWKAHSYPTHQWFCNTRSSVRSGSNINSSEDEAFTPRCSCEEICDGNSFLCINVGGKGVSLRFEIRFSYSLRFWEQGFPWDMRYENIHIVRWF